ncbi:MAG: hypothetical protein KKE98_01860 [Nanoarchaeota archaeon]|nr:hypothetical protein [Nanoarchaeota archaeon]MBU1597165.1 hypothetical protein [Nanoarchaeota archaeon]MBU2441662.1 hypothetical protein [Nanoarchaeota archaeon]
MQLSFIKDKKRYINLVPEKRKECDLIQNLRKLYIFHILIMNKMYPICRKCKFGKEGDAPQSSSGISTHVGVPYICTTKSEWDGKGNCPDFEKN